MVTNLDLLTYAGVKATVDELDRSPVTPSCSVTSETPSSSSELIADARCRRSFRRRKPRRPVDRRPVGVPGDQRGGNRRRCSTPPRRHRVPRFIHVSTDEVYGSVAEGFAPEIGPPRPLVAVFRLQGGQRPDRPLLPVTFDYPVIVTRCTNNYGPYQFPEKVIPLFVTNLARRAEVPLYGDRVQRAGLALCGGPLLGPPPARRRRHPGRDLQHRRQCPDDQPRPDPTASSDHGQGRVLDRVRRGPGHDLRYAVDSSKIRAWAGRRPLLRRASRVTRSSGTEAARTGGGRSEEGRLA